MIDQLRLLRDQLDTALAALEPLAPVLALMAPATTSGEPKERREPAPGPPGAPAGSCARCGAAFRPTGRKRFCGDRCRMRDEYERKRAKKVAARREQAAPLADLEPLPDDGPRDHRVKPLEIASPDPSSLAPPPLPWERNGAEATR